MEDIKYKYFVNLVLQLLLDDEVINKTLFPNNNLSSAINSIQEKFNIIVRSVRFNNGICHYSLMPNDIKIIKEILLGRSMCKCTFINTCRKNNNYEHLWAAPWLLRQ